jgi:hypothetical protein
MVKQELIKRSPLRILEKALSGGLGAGNIAILASRKGVGKTACLVHIATDKLFQGKSVIHVSYSPRVDNIIHWYEDIFKEIAKKRSLEAAVEIHDELIKNRVIMNFHQEGTKTEQVLRSLEVMITQGRFAAETVIVDGYDFTRSVPEDLHRFREFAQRLNLEVWFSASLKGAEPVMDECGFPLVLEPFISEAAVIITLRFQEGQVRLCLVKSQDSSDPRELPLRLDPKTLLIAENV